MNEKFKGFTSKRQLVDFLMKLKKENDLELIEFATGLFKVIKSSNLVRYENNAKPNQEILDAFSRLLVGDEVCSAIAISGSKLLLATNKHFHADDYLKYKRDCILLKRGRRNQSYTLKFIDTVTYFEKDKTPRVITKESESVVYELKKSTKKGRRFEVKTGNPRIIFTQDDHGILFPNNPNVTLSINVSFKKNEDEFSKVFSIPNNSKIELVKETPININPLKRRSAKLFRILALISNSVLNPKLKQKAEEYLERLKEWPQFLNDSLTYEITKSYKENIKPDIFGIQEQGKCLNSMKI